MTTLASAPATLGTLAQTIDRLAEVREMLTRLTEDKGTLTAQIMTVMHVIDGYTVDGIAETIGEMMVAREGAR